MSFQFRRRGDVHEQSPQQEPFFQNSVPQQPFAEQGFYPQMEQQNQGFNPNFGMNNGQMQQQPFIPQNNFGNFYGQQNPQPQMTNQPQGYGFGATQPVPPQVHGQMQQQESYLHPVQASQLNAQRAANYQGNNFQNQNFQQQSYQQPNNYANPTQNQGQNYQANPNSFVPDEPFQNVGNQAAITNPMAYWNDPQPLQRPDDSDSESNNSPVKLLVVVAGVALIAAFSWFAYKWAKAPSSDTPTLIHADPGPHKVSPDHRGGINIPYQDKLIYNRIGDSTSDDPAERLLPPPEQPSMAQNNQGLAVENAQNAPQQQMHPEQFQQNTNPQQPIQQQYVGPQQNMQQQPQPTQNQAVQNQPMQQQNLQQQAIQPPTGQVVAKKQKIEETEADAEPTVVKAKPAEAISGNYFVQLATVKSEAAALKEWKRLKTKHNLKGLKSQIKESERPDGETVFRLLMGPFSEKVKALKYAVKIDGTKVVHVTD
ncbi:MAG: SPOR domain-containing protein [Proteobacteria bacterium]|nr:SPOR domain-containing protein [Pseudomonadota bacterium]